MMTIRVEARVKMPHVKKASEPKRIVRTRESLQHKNRTLPTTLYTLI